LFLDTFDLSVGIGEKEKEKDESSGVVGPFSE